MRETAIKPAHDPQDESVCMAATLTACWPLTAVVVYIVVQIGPSVVWATAITTYCASTATTITAKTSSCDIRRLGSNRIGFETQFDCDIPQFVWQRRSLLAGCSQQ